MSRASKPSTGAACARSSALPCGTPSITSTSTTSPNSLLASQCAAVAPTLPAPTTVILFRLPIILLQKSEVRGQRSDNKTHLVLALTSQPPTSVQIFNDTAARSHI